ncbi:MAG TPA: glycosyltransferase family 1 protein [Blastocatellia bacterium]|nr:glycosyltransferase family 1 protein [Blastocatellia bacterium]HMV82076.1 glycosyltransferase family 1 protein [Blastocatellia bacterium]HMX25942.1 glycosyltransferase family 1 protein [Blastocatellia bacterium]HMY70492.1 glycosyltransferase family 1 protein [Blastocatellia bacterium]HMZ17921.1 glycosyltransferase family 1 protein [Blastocatellia bacterium]
MSAVLINALASTAGGGITYLRNVLPRLGNSAEHHYTVFVPPEHVNNYAPLAGNRVSLETSPAVGTMARMWWEQTALRSLLKARRMDVLLSLGNFAMLRSPVPQILFNRNDLYFSPEFTADLQRRKLHKLLFAHRTKSWLARQSIKQATINLAPTTAFANRIKATEGLRKIKVEALRFGFDAEGFKADQTPLPDALLAKLNLNPNCRRLLYVSHYNYFRNFETLIRALPVIKSKLQAHGQDVQLVLTTDIRRGAVYGDYDATAAARLIDLLAVRKDIAMLGAVEPGKLHRLYPLCDAFVCPSYAESFGHPLVEAMASGVPVIAANLPVHREICEGAAVYFNVFNEVELTEQCLRVLTDQGLSERLRVTGVERSRTFSWDEHVRGLESLIARIASVPRAVASGA